MKTIFYKISIIVTLIFVGSSCNDDFLNTKPVASASPETFYTTVESIDMAVTTCYSYFNIVKLWDLSIMMTLGSIASDEAEAGAGGKGDVLQFQHIDELLHMPNENMVFEETWGYLFRTIGACNVAIEAVPNIEANNAADAEHLDQKLGEAYFLRAFNYFYLTIIFGGVPLVDHVLSSDEFQMPRNSIAEVMGLIKSDLKLAIEKLPTRSEWGSSNIGRASKGTAEALLAKAYLFESSYAKNYADDDRFTGCVANWDSAAYWAEQVISSGEYNLVGIDGERFHTWRDADPDVASTSGYQFIFMIAGNNSEEGVFEIQDRRDGLAYFVSRGEGLVTWCAPRKVHTASGTGNNDHGWGWWCPTDFLVNSYEDNDPREQATVLDENDTLLTDAYGWVTPNFDDLIAATGCHRNSHKYEVSPDEQIVGPSNWPFGPIDVKLIRIADVYLWAAEALFEDGRSSEALPYINAVRQRARNSGDDPTALPDLTEATLTHDAIVNERLVELACEGHRFFDLVRWKLANQYLDHTLSDGSHAEFIEGRHEFYPIPETQISLSGDALVQYPGWN